ncbi:MAG: 4-hydroxy-tetrahydrodipicolinate synthase [Gammaproteobacteria bacterium]|nr:4-hydroxy-tetrahydrodipicolinate synthase [Gammaproteobacteria bacterium]MCD8525544.1 4-hydroxy-tetrahydrodipicolinate synthase [Gammaproteobacteria bacterium]MCD8542059.1 4-hydroxy-tetrahydrodipicolinate synthase [Gammaproteobacteria bacterium]
MKNCMVALVTPMFSDGRVDYLALQKLIEWHINSGMEAIVVLGTTGESPTLTDDERTRIIQTAISQADKRIPIIVGTGTYDTQHSIHLSQQAMSLGADGLLVVTPYYNRPTQNGLYQHFRVIHDAVNIPVILYNNPGRTGCDLEESTIHQLSQLKNIIGLKDTHLDLTRVRRLKQLCGHDFWLWSSNDSNSVNYVRAGGNGVISVIANIVPQEMTQLMRFSVEKNDVETELLHQRLSGLIDASSLESNPIPVKYALYLMKKISEGIRLPLTILEEKHQQVMKNVLLAFNLIKEFDR